MKSQPTTATTTAPRSTATRPHSILPGLGLSLGYTLLYLSLIVLIPLAMLFVKSSALSPQHFWKIVTDPEALAAFRLTFGAALIAALFNVVFGLLLTWVLTRYTFPGRKILDALIDLPFALPTAVAGIALTAVYSDQGWLGRFLVPHGIKVAYTPLGVCVALVFIGLPYVVRTVEPVLQDLDVEIEEAAASLGASWFQTFRRVLLPLILPALITGFALAFARALGEYGSVVFISNNMPYQGEIVPKLIIDKLQSYDYSGATALGLVMLIASFVLLFLVNLLQRWSARHQSV